MRETLVKLFKKEDGQNLTEYTLIVALIAVSLIVVNRYFGHTIRNLFVKAGESLSENQGFYFQVE